MTSINQRAELQAKIWRIANDVRGSVDGWDFKHFVLGTLFYRFISENFATYIEGGDESIDYAKLSDDVITPEIKEDAIKTKGYFIYPSQLFVNVAKTANTNTDLNTDLKSIFDGIEGSANGYPSEPDIKGLFADFDTTSSRLGNTVEGKNDRLAKVLKGIEELTFGNFEDNQIDLFGDAYEFLISNYAANAGKSGGEFFTPQTISKLIAQLAMHGQTSVNKIYDPAAGSGSLLLQAKKHFDNHIIEEGFFGQEINHTTYNLARMNMFLHNVNYDKFNIVLGDTLLNPQLGDDKPFDAIVSNPPYSIKWIGNDDPTLINDDRFAPAGVLAPKSKADFAFVLHALSYLSSKGRAAIVCFPGIFYRGGAEQKIRKYLVDNNYVETVISVAPNLFFGTSIAVNILVLSKNKTDNTTQFIDASGEGFFKKATNTNVLTDKHIDKIMKLFDNKEDVDHIAVSVDNDKIAEIDYNLSVSTYVVAKDPREKIDIGSLNKKISESVKKVNSLQAEIDQLIKQFDGAPQLDKLMKGVEIVWKNLDEVTSVMRGRRLTRKLLSPEEKFPVFHGGLEPLGYYSSFNRPANTVMIINVGASAGTVGYSDVEFWSSDGCYCLEQKEGINNKFLYYFLLGEQHFLKSRVRVAGIPTLDAFVIEKLQIPIPCPDNPKKSLEFQNEIVSKLDAFTKLLTELSAEHSAREKQYEYYRNALLTFPKDKLVE